MPYFPIRLCTQAAALEYTIIRRPRLEPGGTLKYSTVPLAMAFHQVERGSPKYGSRCPGTGAGNDVGFMWIEVGATLVVALVVCRRFFFMQ